MRRTVPLNKKSNAGITMTEMVVVMAIVGILISVGVPSYTYVTNQNRMSAEVNTLLGDMQFARSEALREGRNVIVCVSTSYTSCSSAVTWQSGWIVFSDIDGSGTVSGNDPILRIQKAFTGTDTFKDSANSLNLVTFNREGFATGIPNAGALLVLREQTSNRGYTRCLSVNLVGMLLTQTYATNNACT